MRNIDLISSLATPTSLKHTDTYTEKHRNRHTHNHSDTRIHTRVCIHKLNTYTRTLSSDKT